MLRYLPTVIVANGGAVAAVSRNMLAISRLVFAVTVFFAAGCGGRPRFDAKIEQGAFEMVNLSALNPVVAEFIEQIRTEKSLGLPGSDFPELSATADSIKPLASGNGAWYVWNLPMTDEAQRAFDAALANGTIPRWPIMAILRRKDTETVEQAALVTQAL